MASRFYAVDKGQDMTFDVTESSSTQSKGIEVQVDLAKVTSNLQVIDGLKAIINYIKSVETDPVA